MTAKWIKSFERWVADKRWAANVARARKMRRDMGFMQRLKFDDELKPFIGNDGLRIAYPDALYHITIDDVCRACFKAKMEMSS